ncbi:Gluconolactonase precursor [Gemmata obscuriglobus]|uniref:SMP-30/gluconolactonase/LRE family protein n=1 Tax=Gemmata obscuriglobus TaxID=114 RepID=A0A2Z3H868_9BACT|nr:SMP-30/gluconolactonase/LRE family protein [Gemmata obscuriglobus]AWM39717.1 SMP-30/gluconolactonase/LRE family protein [Gemmata obscuriglobus]QEG27170.1 Gluconolactonase precursor [Gemmata obscuriglobus]VTS03808.1 Gluconolactonase OS=Singulisphaera acidiphila (strain ATCC BAA-1392 / DSM 18658 / VKM B-2454 / MOB10) GN=Sinac_5868 PE=4 SV=1: SGL [Gemmata obscuriglobus UQM 2246]
MFRSLAAVAAAALVAVAVGPRPPLVGAEEPKLPMTLGSIDRRDAKLDALIPKDARIEVLAGGFKWTEGPVWDKKGNALLFTDIPNNRVVKWSAKDGVSDFLKPSGYTGKAEFKGQEPGANGLAFDKDGHLILCQHGDRRIARLKDGKFETLADKYMGKRFNSPNDLVLAKNGDIYFTDPPYGLPEQVKDPAKELDFQGVYRLSPKGEVTLLTKEMTRPNGVALAPDEKTLYVANSDPDKAVWMAFPIGADGALGKGKLLYDATADVKAAPNKGLPDGLKVDAKGNIFATAVNGVYVFSPEGTLLGRIVTNDKTANCGWGDDGTVLYLATNDKLTRVKTITKGLGW